MSAFVTYFIGHFLHSDPLYLRSLGYLPILKCRQLLSGRSSFNSNLYLDTSGLEYYRARLLCR